MKIYEITGSIEIYEQNFLKQIENLYNLYCASYDESCRKIYLEELEQLFFYISTRERSAPSEFIKMIQHNIQNNIRKSLTLHDVRKKMYNDYL